MAFRMAVERWLDVARMDGLARQDTPVHRIDARAQAVTTLLFIGVVMSFARDELSALTPFFIYPVAVMSAGRIPAASLLRKRGVAMPFAGAVGLLNPVFDTRPALAVGPLHVSSGWLSFLSIVMRCLLTVSAALLLVACTGMPRLCEGLVRLGVPRVFAVQLLFLYRYLFLLADEGRRMTHGIALRSPGARGVRFACMCPWSGICCYARWRVRNGFITRCRRAASMGTCARSSHPRCVSPTRFSSVAGRCFLLWRACGILPKPWGPSDERSGLMPPVIEVMDASYVYPDGTQALRAVSLCVETGEAVALVGANGAGKSTCAAAHERHVVRDARRGARGRRRGVAPDAEPRAAHGGHGVSGS
jgi:cobalt/nickel transport system permease protein